MKKSIIFYVLAGLFVVGGIYGVAEEGAVMLIVALAIAAVFVFFGYKGQVKNKAAAEKKRLDDAKKRRDDARVEARRKANKTVVFKVAGVTFDNGDGKSRQAILKRLFVESNSDDWRGMFSVVLRLAEHEGEDAIAVLLDDEQVGFVPKDLLPLLLKLYSDELVAVWASAEISDFIDDNDKIKYYCEVSYTYRLAEDEAKIKNEFGE